MSRRSDEVTVSAWQPWSASHDALPQSPESATLAVDAKAKALKAAGEDVIGFGAGEPDFPTPDAIVEAAAAACHDPANHRYTPTGGLPELRAGDRREDQARLGPRVAPSRRCSSPTAASRPSTTRSRRCSTRATRCCCRRRTGRPTPSRSPSAAACRSWCRPTVAAGFRVTIDQLEAALTPRTKALVFVSPSNPSGAVYPPAEVEAIGRWAVGEGHLGRHRRDLRAPHLRRPRVLVDAGARARARRSVRRRERRRQDLRDDRLAGRLDDRPERRHEGRDQPAEPQHVERRRRLAARRGGRAER